MVARGDSVDAIEPFGMRSRLSGRIAIISRLLRRRSWRPDKTADAEATLEDLLERRSDGWRGQSHHGQACWRRKRYAEAISYFHRAIYGQWGQQAAAKRLRARFELIDLFAQRDSKEDLLAELLPVQDQVPRDLQARARMGRLFLRAGSPTRAADIFRGIVQEAPGNAEGYAGLGESEFAQANYRGAERDFKTCAALGSWLTTRSRNETGTLRPTAGAGSDVTRTESSGAIEP